MKLRQYSKKKIDGGVVITRDGHTMFFEDVVKDLNQYYSGFVKLNYKIQHLEQRNKELKEALCRISASSISEDGIIRERDILLKFREIARAALKESTK